MIPGRTYRTDALLLLLYITMGIALQFAYPLPQFTWESYSYLEASRSLQPNVYPMGYSYFLRGAYEATQNIQLVVWMQLLLMFFAITRFARIIQKICALSEQRYALLAVILLIEPTAIYLNNTILPDSIRCSVIIFFLTALLHWLEKGKWGWFLCAMMLALTASVIDHELIWLPAIALLLIVVYYRRKKVWIIGGTLATILTMSGFYLFQTRYNEQHFGTSVYDPLRSWTKASNALYLSDHLYEPLQTNDKQLSELHEQFSNYSDTTTEVAPPIRSGYLWHEEGPLCQARQRLQDSLHINFVSAWYRIAPLYERYGDAIKTRYPQLYLGGFVRPNLHALSEPEFDFMQDFYHTPPVRPDLLERYHINPQKLNCNTQPYKSGINEISLRYFQLRMILFGVAILFLLVFRKKIHSAHRKLLFTTIAFCCGYVCVHLFSHWITFRDVLPLMPLMTAVIVVMIMGLTGKEGRVSKPLVM